MRAHDEKLAGEMGRGHRVDLFFRSIAIRMNGDLARASRAASEQAATSAKEREEALCENLEQAKQMMALKNTAQKATTKADVAVHKADTAPRLATKQKEDADRAKAALEVEKQRKRAEEKKRSGAISTGGLSK